MTDDSRPDRLLRTEEKEYLAQIAEDVEKALVKRGFTLGPYESALIHMAMRLAHACPTCGRYDGLVCHNTHLLGPEEKT